MVPVPPRRRSPRRDASPRSRRGARASPLLILRDVGHVYSRRTPWAHRALAGVNLRIDRGEALLVVGHNGSGKSTLAWILAGLLEPSEGDARIEGRPLQQCRGAGGRRVPARAVAAPAPDGLRRSERGVGRDAVGRVALAHRRRFRPGEIGPRRVDELSGGEARRVVLAGALARRPSALVLDEPFAGLDDRARAELGAALIRLRAEQRITSSACRTIATCRRRSWIARSSSPAAASRTTGRVAPVIATTSRGEPSVSSRRAPSHACASDARPRSRSSGSCPATPSCTACGRARSCIAAGELALVASIAPTWLTFGVVACVVAIGLLVAQIPLGAFPRLPRGLYLLLLLGLAINAISTTPPVVHLGPLPISLGALADAVRFLLLGGGDGRVGRARGLDDPARSGRAGARPARAARCACCASPSTSGSWRSRCRCGACRSSSTRCARSRPPAGSGTATPTSTGRRADP